LQCFKRDQEQAKKTANPETEKDFDRLNKMLDVAILTLAKMAEIRANGGSSNPNELRKICRALSEAASSRPAFKGILTPKYIDALVRSSVLHDIGKAALPDSALQGEEWTNQETLRQHPVFGGRILEEAAAMVGEDSLFSVAKDMSYYHHEHWDGSGYPFGLPGEEIPLAARILAVAEAYLHIVSGSTDQEPCSHEEACKRILEDKGTKFDPEIVEVLLEVGPTF
jgi:putative two-component system response regulator